MSGGQPPSQPLTQPTAAPASIVPLHWTPAQALAVFECMQALREALWTV